MVVTLLHHPALLLVVLLWLTAPLHRKTSLLLILQNRLNLLRSLSLLLLLLLEPTHRFSQLLIYTWYRPRLLLLDIPIRKWLRLFN